MTAVFVDVVGGSPRGQVKVSAAQPCEVMRTVSEGGLRGFEAGSWYGILVPAGTPPDVVDKLNREIVRIVALPDVQDKLIELGLVPFTNSPADYAAMIKADRDRYATIIKQVGVKLE